VEKIVANEQSIAKITEISAETRSRSIRESEKAILKLV